MNKLNYYNEYIYFFNIQLIDLISLFDSSAFY